MPTYEYECTKCGKVTEVFQSMTEAPRRKLRKDDRPSCRCNAPVQRRISGGAGLIFKGSGFYITDYRSDSYKEAAKKETEPVSGEGKKEAGKKDEGTTSKDTAKPDTSSGAGDSKAKPVKKPGKGSSKAKGERVGA